MLKLIAEDKEAVFILTSENNSETYASSDELYECMKQFADINKIYKKSLDDAIDEAMNSDLSTATFIIGSFYTYGTVIDIIKNKQFYEYKISSFRVISFIIEINGNNIIKITVSRASRREKPIYINNNPITGTYKRNHSGDYKCTEGEIRRMFAEQSDIARDNIAIEDVTIDDINTETLISYRKRFSIVRGTTHAWVALSDNEFLYQIGAIEKDKKHLTLAGLLLFGNERVITDILPTYFLDYREVNFENTDERWSNRIISSDGSWSGNLYDFYFKIIIIYIKD